MEFLYAILVFLGIDEGNGEHWGPHPIPEG